MANNCKYYKQQRQVSYDGGVTWQNLDEYQRGELYQSYSEDCGTVLQYRWVVLENQYYCNGTSRYAKEQKQISYDNGQTWQNVSPAEYRAGQIVEYNSEICGYVPSPYSEQYLTIESLEDNNEISYKGKSSDSVYATPISASTNGGMTWFRVVPDRENTPKTIATLNAGQKLLLKGENASYTKTVSMHNNRFLSTKRVDVYGNIMSLIYGDLFYGQTAITSAYTFTWLFEGTDVVNSSNLILPSNVTSYCYAGMFSGCTNLISTPLLPATTMAARCYYQMFEDCTSLTTAPALPATTLASHCYTSMFEDCTSLTTPPVLSATTLAEGCYAIMFKNCTSLTTPPALPATTLAKNCYSDMFEGCTSLTTAPVLSATTLAENCYKKMFNGCTSLTTIQSALPATTLANNCYEYMFSGCTSLTTAPVLPATSTVTGCYTYMFGGCTSLTTVPEISATYIKGRQSNESLEVAACCKTFEGCSNLSYIKCMATTIGFAGTVSWVKGVASSGTFVKNPSMTNWESGDNGIPTGWTITDA